MTAFKPYETDADDLLNEEGLVVRFADPNYHPQRDEYEVVQGIITFTDFIIKGAVHEVLVRLDNHIDQVFYLPLKHPVTVHGQVSLNAVSYINRPQNFQS